MISTIRSMDLGEGFPRPTVLGSYWAVFEDYLQAILQLVTWCQSKHKSLRERGIAGLQEVAMPDLKWENSEADAMIHPEELDRQIKAFEESRKSRQKLDT